MIVNALLSYSCMNARDFKQFEIGKLYIKRIKEVAEENIISYYRDIYVPDNFELNMKCNTFKDYYTNDKEQYDDIIKNITMMRDAKLDIAIFLVDTLAFDATVESEIAICKATNKPIMYIYFDEIVKEVQATDEGKAAMTKIRRNR